MAVASADEEVGPELVGRCIGRTDYYGMVEFSAGRSSPLVYFFEFVDEPNDHSFTPIMFGMLHVTIGGRVAPTPPCS